MKTFFRVLALTLLTACASVSGPDSPNTESQSLGRVLVSIAPYRYFVKRLAGDLVNVHVLVPPDVSAHHYEPTPRQVTEASQSELWFRFGEPFEGRVLNAMAAQRPDLKIVDLREGLDLIAATHSHDHHHGHDHGHGHHHHHGDHGMDLHLWLSARMAKVQARAIAAALSEQFPEGQEVFAENLEAFLSELDQVDAELTRLFADKDIRYILVSHDAYGYFCRDYGLEQLPIEWKGKDPTTKQLGNVINRARDEGLTRVFTQPQHSSKGAELVARELGLEIIDLDPYSEDYLENLRLMGRKFAGE